MNYSLLIDNLAAVFVSYCCVQITTLSSFKQYPLLIYSSVGQKLGLHSMAGFLLDWNQAVGRGCNSYSELRALFHNHWSWAGPISFVEVLVGLLALVGDCSHTRGSLLCGPNGLFTEWMFTFFQASWSLSLWLFLWPAGENPVLLKVSSD